jgi:hypothetical protein
VDKEPEQEEEREEVRLSDDQIPDVVAQKVVSLKNTISKTAITLITKYLPNSCPITARIPLLSSCWINVS